LPPAKVGGLRKDKEKGFSQILGLKANKKS